MRLLTLLLPALGAALPAYAQENATVQGFDAHGFQLTAFDGDPRDPLRMQRPGRFSQGEFWVGGLFEYASDPLVLYTTYSDPELNEETEILSDVFAFNLSGGVAVLNWLRVDLALPLYLSTTGTEQAPEGLGLGDARLSFMGAILRPDEGSPGGFGLGIVPFVDLPLGAPARFIGQGGLAFGGKLAATYELEKLTLGADLGAQFNPEIELDNLTNSDRLVADVGVGYLFTENVGINGEVSFAPPFKANEAAGSDSPIEAILSLRGRNDVGGFWTVGGAAALSEGASASTYRVFVGGGFGKLDRKPKDMDLDGIGDKVDACPEQPETVNTWKDADGCPDQLGDLAVAVTWGGKQMPGAEVQILGPDKQPKTETSGEEPIRMTGLTPETNWLATATYAPCLEGSGSVNLAEGANELQVALHRTAPAMLHFEVTGEDGKPLVGVLARIESDHPECVMRGRVPLGNDGKANQETGAGKFHVTLTQNDYLPYETDVSVEPGGEATIKVQMSTGKVKVSEAAIVILDKVYFETDKDVIKPESFPLLDQVAAIFKSHPEIKKVEISGHTDSQGKDAYNLDLSDRRAKSVRQYLINKGIAAERMDAKGYGETKPIATNSTASGRAQNRRVEFNILVKEETPEGTEQVQ